MFRLRLRHARRRLGRLGLGRLVGDQSGTESLEWGLVCGLLIIGAMLLVVGLVFMLLGRTNLPIGRLPGDIIYRGKNTTFYFPLATSILLSVVLSVLLYVIGRLKR